MMMRIWLEAMIIDDCECKQECNSSEGAFARLGSKKQAIGVITYLLTDYAPFPARPKLIE